MSSNGVVERGGQLLVDTARRRRPATKMRAVAVAREQRRSSASGIRARTVGLAIL